MYRKTPGESIKLSLERIATAVSCGVNNRDIQKSIMKGCGGNDCPEPGRKEIKKERNYYERKQIRTYPYVRRTNTAD